jgi:hypothetical protein
MALPVREIVAKQAMLFLWATVPMLPQALATMDAWGFKYVSGLCWQKGRIGTGYWVRNKHELLLIGKRGGFPAPRPAMFPTSIIQGGQREHSRKPDWVHEVIEAKLPDTRKVELFARQGRFGWASWGGMKGMSGHQAHGSGETVWLTPPYIIEALGPFDLDPCFGEPRPWATAREHLGPTDANGLGGLHATWHGMVWCNPPYDAKAWDWLDRCARHGNAIALIFARTEVEQFHRQVWEKADAALFLEGRLYFHKSDGARAAHNAGAPSVLVAYGAEAAMRVRQSAIRGIFVHLKRRVA